MDEEAGVWRRAQPRRASPGLCEVQHAPPAGESGYQYRVAPQTGRNLLVLLTVITFFIFMKRSILTYFEANVGPHVFVLYSLFREKNISDFF